MFTGIVRTIGRVMERSPHRLALHIEDLALVPGASLAVNGICLTVVESRDGRTTMDLSAETLGRTALGDLRPGDPVNLEPALRVGDELGGHFLLGHVDTVGKVALAERRGEGVLLGVSFDPRFAVLLADKGSVGVDGVSLTPFLAGEGSFRCAVVPYTWAHTNLSSRRVGDRVNLEFDVLAKYVRRWRET
ncbi:TPA: riboflavin synthase [Candidatus Acetothermia bacterium]|nr:riboflavin synthase [Candidatus Acetothermia bacterium]HAZ30389.1 riboflavin synthase [Candidatus Acetothermia bacterium]